MEAQEDVQLRRNPVAVWAAMVAERNLAAGFLDVATAEAIEDAVQSLTHVRLDREQILVLEPAFFLCFKNLTCLYLQENVLTTLKGIEAATELQFLAVTGNKLTSLQGLKDLPKLAFLDASKNSIHRIEPESELPKSIYFLNVSKNPCCELQAGLQEVLATALPDLKELQTEARKGSTTSKNSDQENVAAKSKDEEEAIKDEPPIPFQNEDPFLRVLEQSFQHLGTKKQPTSEPQDPRQIARIMHMKNVSSQEALEDADLVFKTILQSTGENMQHNFDKIQQRSHLRVLKDGQDRALTKKIKKPVFVKPSLRNFLDSV